MEGVRVILPKQAARLKQTTGQRHGIISSRNPNTTTPQRTRARGFWFMGLLNPHDAGRLIGVQ